MLVPVVAHQHEAGARIERQVLDDGEAAGLGEATLGSWRPEVAQQPEDGGEEEEDDAEAGDGAAELGELGHARDLQERARLR